VTRIGFDSGSGIVFIWGRGRVRREGRARKGRGGRKKGTGGEKGGEEGRAREKDEEERQQKERQEGQARGGKREYTSWRAAISCVSAAPIYLFFEVTREEEGRWVKVHDNGCGARKDKPKEKKVEEEGGGGGGGGKGRGG
jgi:hypothetical protein